MKMNPKSIKDRFNKLAKKGGEAVIYTEAEWKNTGLEAEYGAWQKGKIAIAVFNGQVQEHTQNIRISNVTEDKNGLHVEVYTGILGGPPSRPGHFSYPRDVVFVDDKAGGPVNVDFEYKGVVKPNHIQKSPKVKP